VLKVKSEVERGKCDHPGGHVDTFSADLPRRPMACGNVVRSGPSLRFLERY
jgi:hypothetical protein